MPKGPDAFRTISEAADELGLPQHVLRFWETQFGFLKPLRRAGGRRFYRPQDIAMIAEVRRLLHEEGYTIRAVRKLHQTRGSRAAEEAVAPRSPERRQPIRRNDPDRRDRLLKALSALEDAKRRLETVLGSR